MPEECEPCIFCRIMQLEKRLDDLPDSDEARDIRKGLEELKLDVEVLKVSKTDEHSH